MPVIYLISEKSDVAASDRLVYLIFFRQIASVQLFTTSSSSTFGSTRQSSLAAITIFRLLSRCPHKLLALCYRTTYQSGGRVAIKCKTPTRQQVPMANPNNWISIQVTMHQRGFRVDRLAQLFSFTFLNHFQICQCASHPVVPN